MLTGRPREYDQSVLDKSAVYLSDDDSKNYKSRGHAIPSIVGLCRVLNRARSTLYKWAGEEDKVGFSDMLAKCNEMQELVTLNGSLKNDLNAQISKLVLGKHGYHDKQDTTLEANHKVELTEDQIDDRLRQLIESS